MEQRITSLLLPAPEVELEASCKELDELAEQHRKRDDIPELTARSTVTTSTAR